MSKRGGVKRLNGVNLARPQGHMRAAGGWLAAPQI